MNTRSLLVAAAIVSLTSALAAGCSAPPDSPEGVGTAEQALPPVNAPPPPGGGSCGAAEELGYTSFEGGLRALTCGQKHYTHNAANNAAYFESLCPTNTWALLTCPNGVYGSYDVSEWVNCWANVSGIWSSIHPYMLSCSYAYPPSGHVEVDFDPSCTGGGCGSIPRGGK